MSLVILGRPLIPVLGLINRVDHNVVRTMRLRPEAPQYVVFENTCNVEECPNAWSTSHDGE